MSVSITLMLGKIVYLRVLEAALPMGPAVRSWRPGRCSSAGLRVGQSWRCTALGSNGSGEKGSLPEPDFEELAHCANVGVSERECEALSNQLSDVISWATRLKKLRLDGVKPALGVTPSTNASAAREDVVSPFCPNADIVRMLPDSNSRFAKVPSARGEADDVETLEGTSSIKSTDSGVEPSDSLLGLDLRVGLITSVERHPEADKLYVESVDVGKGEECTICSGLVPYMNPDDLHGSLAVVFANMKGRKMRGVNSQGMLLAASSEGKESVELLRPPEGTQVGERVTWMRPDYEQPEPFTANKVRWHIARLFLCLKRYFFHSYIPDGVLPTIQVQKKKVWEEVQPGLATDEDCTANWCGLRMFTSAGEVKSSSIRNGSVS